MFNSSLFPGSLRRPKPIFELPLNPTRRHYLIRPHKRRLGVSRLNRAGLEGAKERVAGTDETCGSHRIEWPLRSQSASGAAGPEDVGAHASQLDRASAADATAGARVGRHRWIGLTAPPAA